MNTKLGDGRSVGSRNVGTASDVSETKFTVKQSRPGQWAVCESGFEQPLAEFDDRDEAIEYARGIAATKARASLDADGDNGSAALHESFELDPSTHKSL